ncbi:nitroreductase family protein [Neptuniibacter caesariensis]|uniref:Nitroreductase n=1 Tax=Neptuniibacter caesariensis TaxID=207954 RepID=A0A7U8C510_NEPCE|nr:nitroreductase family protein [Neptuniibacter caesariensis]EAR61652.1 Nitroreductase [Neptuniibacter caesariensis]
MSNQLESILQSRASVGKYQTGKQIPQQDIQELLRLATLSPSAFNMQNWHFLVVNSDEAKQRLHPIAYYQPQILDASATVVICGDLDGYQRLEERLTPSVEAGILNDEIVKGWSEMVNSGFADNPQAQRDEAVRAASLAAMTLMLAASGKGIASGAMSGFDAQGLQKEFGLAKERLPVLLVTLGYPDQASWPQKPRVSVQDVMSIV